MIRFIPDTLRDALWRPIAMAAPDGGIYVEIMAPDVRFACLLLLTVATVFFAVRRGTRMSPTWLLLAFVWLTFFPWLATTGNGRYFIAVLLIAGPLCLALIHQLPLTRAFRLTAAVLVVALQGFVLVQNDPWRLWALAPWGDPYFQVSLDPEDRESPATYVFLANISYSLIAPQFDHRSRWISVAALSGDPENSSDARQAETFFRRAATLGQSIKLVVPTVPDYMDSRRQPNQAIRAQINRMLAAHQLTVQPTAPCKMIESRGLASVALKNVEERDPARVATFGFWICPLAYPVPRPTPAEPSPASAKADQVFARLERDCPRMFQPGEAANARMTDGFSRTYPSSDTKAYVLDSGEVLYKYWRALNPGTVGTVDSVLADGFKMDCNAIRGRSGLPWERQL